jgi:glycosyltransferase involved in cell wall biosynthesis
VEQTAAMGLGQRVFFAGFLRGADVDRAFRMADVYVMPSVSEPFGMTALEAIRNGTPVIISNTAGVAEVLSAGVLKADFWDIEKLAEHIQTVLCSRQVADRLRRSAALEAARLPWSKAAGKCRRIYQESTRTIAMAGTNN